MTAGTAPAFASLLQSFPRALDGNCFPQVPLLDEASFPVNPGVCGVCSPRDVSWGLHPLVPLHEHKSKVIRLISETWMEYSSSYKGVRRAV